MYPLIFLFHYDLAVSVEVWAFEPVQVDAGNDRFSVIVAAVPGNGFDLGPGGAGEQANLPARDIIDPDPVFAAGWNLELESGDVPARVGRERDRSQTFGRRYFIDARRQIRNLANAGLVYRFG